VPEGHIQGTSREHSGNIQGTFRENSGNIQGTFREYPGNIQLTFSEHSVNINGTSTEETTHPIKHLDLFRISSSCCQMQTMMSYDVVIVPPG
jgi:hypothetical protein